MSIEASLFVLGLSMGRGNGIRMLILLGYANHADKRGRGAYPSARTIVDYAEWDVRTVQRQIGWLLERGYLHEGDQQMVDHLDPRYRPIVYDVAISTEQIHRWAADTDPSGGSRTRAARAGRRGGLTSSHVSRGDNLSPLPEDGSQQVSRGDNVSPLETGPTGDNSSTSGVTNDAARGDTCVTRTVQEPPREPSSSSPAPAGAVAAPAGQRGGGMSNRSLASALDLLPETVRNHPSVILGAIAKRIQFLDKLGWSRAEIQRRLIGVETAHTPGAAALTRLDALAIQSPPSPPTATSSLVRTVRSTHPHAGGSVSRRPTLPLFRVPSGDDDSADDLARPVTRHGHSTPRPIDEQVGAALQ